MNDLFKIIVKSLRGNSFYIPSKNTFVNGCSLTVKQYNELLDLDATTDFSFEQFIKYSIITDRIILDNIDKVDDMLYFDKNFILIQIKMDQENSFLGLPLADYQANLKNKMENFSLSSYETAFIDTNLKISFGLNDFQTVVKTNKEYLISLKNNYNYPGEIISLEIFKYLQNIEYLNQSITENKEIICAVFSQNYNKTFLARSSDWGKSWQLDKNQNLGKSIIKFYKFNADIYFYTREDISVNKKVISTYNINEIKNETYEIECEYIGENSVPFDKFISSLSNLYMFLLNNSSYC